MTQRTVVAVAVSLLVHALLAVALGVWLEYAPQPDVLATLDLSSVELSFAEKEEETAAVAPAVPTPPAPPKPQDEKPPEAKPEKPLPPDPAAPKLREPKEDVRLKTEDARQEASPVAPRQAKIDAPPRPKRDIRPDYPKGARQRGEQGDVVVEIRVGADGLVAAAHVVTSCGFAELDAAALKAVKAAKFAPARSGREAVASTARLKLSFKLK